VPNAEKGKYRSIYRDDLYEGKVILITGGGTGIGRCIAHELAALGAKVLIAARRAEPLQETVAEIEADGGKAAWMTMNIRDEEDVEAKVQQAVKDHGTIHALVNNAGGQFASPAVFIKPKGWRAVIDTNLTGTWLVTQAVYNHALCASGGSIVNIVADMWNGFPMMAHTGAARAGVVNMTKTLSIEWAAAGVRVNAVAPGIILSSGMHTYPKDIQKMTADICWKNPSSRLGTESEVSTCVAFLLSPAAAYITGETLRVDGGASLSKENLLAGFKHKAMKPWDGFHRATDIPEAFKDL